MSLAVLETIVVEIEAIFNDHPLTFVSSEFGDPEPLTPAHLLHGHRITGHPHQTIEIDELADPNYGEAAQIWRRAKLKVGTSKRDGGMNILPHCKTITRHLGKTNSM